MIQINTKSIIADILASSFGLENYLQIVDTVKAENFRATKSYLMISISGSKEILIRKIKAN